MADTHDTRLRRLRWERRRAGAYRAQATHEGGVTVYALERVGARTWHLVAHESIGARVIATNLRTMREGRDLAQRVADLRARRETQALVRWREALRREAKWRAALRGEALRSEAQAWMSSECTCGSDTQAQAQAQATEWSNGARLTWRPFSELALMLAQAQARVAQ